MKKRYLLLALFTLILGFGSFNKTTLETRAAGPRGSRPTNVNITDASDTVVNNYYAGVAGKSGDELKEALNDIIKDHHEYDYESNNDRLIYKIIDRNWTLSPLTSAELSNFNYSSDNPYIRKLYADYNDDPDLADRFKNEGASRVSFDKEHIWAQSLGDFGRNYGAGSDYHHLLPSDVKGNQQAHSNYNFANPTSGIKNIENDYGTNVGRNGYIPGSSHRVFEPLDQYKGDIARAMFYMATRYISFEDEDHPWLELVNGSPSATKSGPSNPGLAGDLATLLEWNKLDPVDDYEIHRNNLIYNNYQKNRNPFVDHPEWADIVYDANYVGYGASTAPETSSVGTNPAWLDENGPLESISINTSSAQTYFSLNEPFTCTGLQVIAHYEGSPSRLVSNFTTSPACGSILNSPGFHNITVSYTENEITKSTTYQIEVSTQEKTLTSLSLDIEDVQTSFYFNEDFNSDALIVKAHYSDFSEEVINDYNLSEPVMTILGQQLVNITYRGKSTNYSIHITNEDALLNIGYARDLFFSEYIEGSSNNKAIEIFNGTGQSINLSSYSIKLYANGATTAGTTFTFGNNQVLADQQTFVIAHSSANESIKGKSDIQHSVVNYNGDDVVGLYNGNVLIDIIGGPIGEREMWNGTTANNVNASLAEHTLVRIPSIYTPNTTFTWSEWNAYPQDTDTYLGSHSYIRKGLGLDYIDQAISYAEFFIEETGPYCEVLDGGNVNWTYLSNEYGFMDDDSKDYFTNISTTDNEILAAKERYFYLVNKYPSLASNPFVKNANGTSIYSINEQSSLIENTNQTAFFIFASLLMLTSLSFFVYKRKTN